MKALAVDIGNTTISFGVLSDEKILQTWSVSTQGHPSELKGACLKSFCVRKVNQSNIDRILICSVVPKVTRQLIKILSSYFQCKPVVIGRDIKVPIINRYRNPKQVGQDRLVCAYAAKILYGAPVIVIDLGTAITFDAISRKGEYLGGAIVPGLRISLESLYEKTALLPKVQLKFPGNIIGRDSDQSILSGIFYGYGSLCDGMIDQIKEQLGARPQVVLTGGHVSLVTKFIRSSFILEKDLIFKGISFLSKKKPRKSSHA